MSRRMAGVGPGGNATGPIDRSALTARLKGRETWDMVVVGGGATGLGCALDAAARGYRVLLVEAHDFGKGTSSRATKLIHGGVRYLAQGNVPLVTEALLERSRLLRNAPSLVHPLRFVVPAYGWLDKPRFGIGLTLYDLLAGRHGIAPCRLLDPAETVAALPTVEQTGLRGGIAYWDAQFDDSRLCIALMRTLFEYGGVAINYLSVESLITDGERVAGVRVLDLETAVTHDVSARVVINATGVWADRLRGFERPGVKPLLRPSQGVHVVVDAAFLPGADALLVPQTPDGRVLFVIPWQGRVLIGTTDTARSDLPLEPVALAGEIDFILETAGRYLARKPTRADVRSVFAGLRPLIDAGSAARTGRLSREHHIEVSRGGMVTITGGKWTTYRRMAEDCIDVAQSVARLGRHPCVTAELRISASSPGDVGDHPGAERRLADGVSVREGDVVYAAHYELARTVEDMLARRHRALFLDARSAQSAAPAVARILARELGRDEAWCEAQCRAFDTLAAGYL